MTAIRVGVIDSGGPSADIGGSLAFRPDGVVEVCTPDRLGHGTVVANVIRESCPEALITHAQVFGERPVTTALQVALALEWLVSLGGAERVHIVCMSLGLAADRAPLREAITLALEQNVLVVAASPATGGVCYPAAYDGVIAGTGDARCKWKELSSLGPRLFGAWSNSPEHAGKGMAGSSLGAARLAGHLALIVAEQGRCLKLSEAVQRLEQKCSYFGRERRQR